MTRVRIGGIFFQSRNPQELYAWYEKHLGIAAHPDQGASFAWRQAGDPSKEEMTAWAIFPTSTKYFRDSKAPFMVNYIVDDLDATLAALRAEVSPWMSGWNDTATEISVGLPIRMATGLSCGSRKPCRQPRTQIFQSSLKPSLAHQLLYSSSHPSI
jgi:hypothetical protein